MPAYRSVFQFDEDFVKTAVALTRLASELKTEKILTGDDSPQFVAGSVQSAAVP